MSSSSTPSGAVPSFSNLDALMDGRECYVIGMMSGTSMDGVDAALIRTDGERVTEFGPTLTNSYDEDTRRRIREGIQLAFCQGRPGGDGGNSENLPEELRQLERHLTELHAEAAAELLMEWGERASNVAVIGLHGHTLAHRPDQGWTWQIGDGAGLSGQLGLPVVFDFRSADMAAGGQGAPLVPLYHAALLRAERRHDRVAVLNIGGVANVTWIDFSRSEIDPDILAFDTGPGNAMLDDWAAIQTGVPCDTDGELAATGRLHTDVLSSMLASPYFDEAPPKTLDRDDFTIQSVRGLSAADGATTLTDFVVESIVAAQSHFPQPVEAWYVCGGGRHNKTLMRRLRSHLPVLTDPVEILGWRGDALEAEAFGFLAARSVRGLPTSLPSTTGCRVPTVGGRLILPGSD
ncbi:anhydro-N-acetylmuramic acid kinase [Eilatimonas milleporae]|uniref:Anhydro-N-acetylmuramic acid kinase n=2 Tax=Eilatimonas milleporae TaxID=911205 RepID=A0A3M0CG35_9PROT|nr:anhydro-N-acetylmuramic acid kinase [Eilatimonas milleporae]RMB08568.1 anhydro-N-acetylmuramic acid kinase [Eilatimonas milleporae]